GVNKRSALSGSPWDEGCSIVSRDSEFTRLFGPATQAEGCHPSNSSVSSRYDEREATRLDFEWALGDHLLRFGWDQEIMDSNSSRVYPGDGVSYTVKGIAADEPDRTLPNGVAVPDGVTAYIDARHYITGAPGSTEAQAFYIEDVWNVTPNLLLNLGLRADKFHDELGSGAACAKAAAPDMISTRIGCSWDVKGDGSSRGRGNGGRYCPPLTATLTDCLGGGSTDGRTYYVF